MFPSCRKDGCDIPCSFEDVQALDQNAEVGSAPCTDHDRGGSRKPEGTGTNDDQDRHRGDESAEASPDKVHRPSSDVPVSYDYRRTRSGAGISRSHSRLRSRLDVPLRGKLVPATRSATTSTPGRPEPLARLGVNVHLPLAGGSKAVLGSPAIRRKQPARPRVASMQVPARHAGAILRASSPSLAEFGDSCTHRANNHSIRRS